MLKYFRHEVEDLVYKIHQDESLHFIVKIQKDGNTIFVYESEGESLTIAVLKAQMLYKQAVRSLEA